MNNVRFGFFLLFGFVLTTAYGQIQGADAVANLNALSTGESMFRTFDNRMKGVEGTPFIFDTFQKGFVILLSERKIVCNEINFDALHQEVVVMKEGREFTVDMGSLTGFTILTDSDTLLFRKVYNQDGKWVYLQELVSGSYRLVKIHRKYIKESTNTGPYSAASRNGKVEVGNQYFLTTDGRTLVELKNKKQLLSALPEKKTAIELFLKGKHHVFKKEEELIHLVAHLNK